jgi:hypothetical protein
MITMPTRMRMVASCAVLTLFGIADVSKAAMLLAHSLGTPLSGGLTSFTISMFSTAGETIVGFSDPSLAPWLLGGEGAHRAFPPILNAQTPTRPSGFDGCHALAAQPSEHVWEKPCLRRSAT